MLGLFIGEVRWPYTNESLEAIVTGLDLSEEEDVLAVCGSGDQAFAIIEKAKTVTAVDTDKRQVEYAVKQAEKLREKRYEDFHNSGSLYDLIEDPKKEYKQNRNSYFNRERLIRITGKLNNLTIVCRSIFDNLPTNKFSRIYASTVFYQGNLGGLSAASRFQNLSSSLKNKGLLYLSLPRGLDIEADLKEIAFPLNLFLHKSLTTKARELENDFWNPYVLIKESN